MPNHTPKKRTVIILGRAELAARRRRAAPSPIIESEPCRTSGSRLYAFFVALQSLELKAPPPPQPPPQMSY